MKAMDQYEESGFEMYANLGARIQLTDCPFDDSLGKSFWYVAVRNAANSCKDSATVDRFHPDRRESEIES